MKFETILCPRCGAPVQQGQRYCGQCGTAIELAPPGGARDGESAENRQLTIIFADIVNSTFLTDQLGAEAFRDILREYRERAAGCFQKYGGFIARFFGDGTLVYFGYPAAHEDDAWRAIQASLDVQSSLLDLSRNYLRDRAVDFRVRIAVHTGIVVAGDIRSASATERMAIIGNAPNVAARLQELSEPGAVTISEATFRLVQHAFECVPMGEATIRGLAEPIGLYRVNGLARGATGFGYRNRATPLIGREQSLSQLETAWQRASDGQGSVLQLNGEAGVGKTRLIGEFASRLATQRCFRIVWRCSPLHENTALFPLIQHLSNTLELAQTKTPAEKLASIEQAFENEPREKQYVELCASLLGVTLPAERYNPLGLTAEQERALLQDRLVEWFITATQSRSVLLVVEDLHWADPSTVELLAKLAPRVGGLRMLLVLSSRPAPALDWVNRSHGATMTLHRLSDEDTRRMIETISGDHAFGSVTIEMLSARMDGVPLFIEEITRAVVEAERAGTPRSGRPMMIPATLQESLAGRIDRVGVDREVLHLSATLGREFSLEVLDAVCGGDRADLQRELDKLLSSGLLEACEIGGQSAFRYRHALIQDAIYQFQLSGQRQIHHQRIADVLIREFPETCQRSPEVIANHLLEARNPAAALSYLQRAAHIAVQRSANIEAARYLHLALEAVATLPPDRGRTYIELELLTSLGVIQSAQLGFASDEAGDAFARARSLSRSVNRVAGLFPVLHGLYRFYLVRVELETAINLSREMLKIARTESDPALLLEAHRAAGNCRFLAGDFGKAERHFGHTLLLYHADTHHAHRFAYGTDPFVVAASMRAITSYIQGARQQARQHMAEALGAAEQLNHPYSVCWALSFASLLSVVCGDIPSITDYSERMLSLAKRNGFKFWELPPNVMLGWAKARQDPGGPGIQRMRGAIDGWRASGAIAYLPFFQSLLADAYLHADRVAEAEVTIREAHGLAEKTRELWWRAEMYRLEGLCARARGGHAAAEARFREAIGFAQRQRASSLMERAQADLDSLRNTAEPISNGTFR